MSTKKVIDEFEKCQQRVATVIQELDDDLERMRENPKIPQSVCNKRDAQIEAIVNFNNAADELLKIFRKREEIISDLGKVPPSATDLEESILGALIIENKEVADIAPILKPQHFYSDRYRDIYEAILDLYNEGANPDMRSVVVRLRKKGLIEKIGGAYAIAEITALVSSAASLEYHARCVIEFSIKRQLIRLGNEIQLRAYDDTFDVFELLDYVKDRYKHIEKTHIIPNPKPNTK